MTNQTVAYNAALLKETVNNNFKTKFLSEEIFVVYSYFTPIAVAKKCSSGNFEWTVTKKKYSKTTSTHTNLLLKYIGNNVNITEEKIIL